MSATAPPTIPAASAAGAVVAESAEVATAARGVPRTRSLAAAGLVLLAALFWTVTELLPTRLVAGHSLWQVVWLRYATHLLLMLAVLTPRHGLAWLRTRRPALQAGRGLLMVVMPASFIAAVGRVGIENVLAVFWLVPLLLLAFAAVLHRERARWLLWGAAVAAALGAQMILRPGPGVWAALPYGLGMGASFALYVVLTRSLRDENTAANLFYSALAVFVPLTFFVPAFWSPLGWRDGLVMAGVGISGLGVLWAVDRATDLAPISGIAPLFSLEVVLIGVAAPLLAGMRPGRLALAGTLLILAAAGIAFWMAATSTSTPGRPQQPALTVHQDR